MQLFLNAPVKQEYVYLFLKNYIIAICYNFV